MKKLVYLFIFFAICVNAQKINVTVKVEELPENTVLELLPQYIRAYYENPVYDSIENTADKNTFHIDKTTFYYPYTLSYQEEENVFQLSRTFFLKNKNLNLNLNDFRSEILNDLPEKVKYNEFFKDYKIEEDAFNEYYGQMFLKYKFEFPKEVNDSINKWYNKVWMHEIELLDKYVKSNPGSVIAFWKIVEKYERYKEYPYENILNQFDASVKQSFPFKKLISNIEENKIFGQGRTFPEIKNLKDQSGKSAQINYKTKYTLIDFWFHSCKPCLVSFPDLKEVYQKYNSKGFEIVAISAEATKYIPNWKNTIKKYELPWVNLLDENREFTSKNQITSFPTNFLVDQNGKIIFRDISTSELEKFLYNNLEK